MAARGGVNTPGVKKLLEAEARAAETVKRARNQKALRIKQAREEAEAEINAYRAQREAEFQRNQRQHAGNTDDVAQRIQRETDEKIKAMEKRVADNQEEVIQTLLKLVCTVEPRLHENFGSRK
eukprot:m.52153 g.52153  ORF g.52153 m.52153 type:complete len:123 (+) comp11758_c0_seq1:5677-6045(+)